MPLNLPHRPETPPHTGRSKQSQVGWSRGRSRTSGNKPSARPCSHDVYISSSCSRSHNAWARGCGDESLATSAIGADVDSKAFSDKVRTAFRWRNLLASTDFRLPPEIYEDLCPCKNQCGARALLLASFKEASCLRSELQSATLEHKEATEENAKLRMEALELKELKDAHSELKCTREGVLTEAEQLSEALSELQASHQMLSTRNGELQAEAAQATRDSRSATRRKANANSRAEKLDERLAELVDVEQELRVELQAARSGEYEATAELLRRDAEARRIEKEMAKKDNTDKRLASLLARRPRLPSGGAWKN